MSNNNNKVFLTVSTGTTGQWVAKYLSEQKDIDAYCGVRSIESEFAKALDEKLDIHLVGVEYDDPKSLDNALKDMNTVIFITPLVPSHQEISDKWIEAIKRSNVKHIVRLSVYSAGDPKQLIEEWHAVTEVVLKGLDDRFTYTIIRPGLMSQNIGNFYGPTVKATKKLYIPAGDGAVAFVDARDIAKVLVHVACNQDKYKNMTLDVNGAVKLTMKDVADIISDVLKSEVEYVDLPPENAKNGLLQAGVPEVLVNISEETNALIKSGHYAKTDNSIKEMLGVEPCTFKSYVNAYKIQF